MATAFEVFPEFVGPNRQPALGNRMNGSGGCRYTHFFSGGLFSAISVFMEQEDSLNLVRSKQDFFSPPVYQKELTLQTPNIFKKKECLPLLLP